MPFSVHNLFFVKIDPKILNDLIFFEDVSTIAISNTKNIICV